MSTIQIWYSVSLVSYLISSNKIFKMRMCRFSVKYEVLNMAIYKILLTKLHSPIAQKHDNNLIVWKSFSKEKIIYLSNFIALITELDTLLILLSSLLIFKCFKNNYKFRLLINKISSHLHLTNFYKWQVFTCLNFFS